MRLAFMGTPEFAVPTLAALVESRGHDLIFVVTQPDKPQGRGMHLQSPPVKDLAVKEGIRVVQPVTLRGNADIRKLFSDSRLDAAVVVAYGKMIPEDWLSIPRLGFINVHASLLPEFRGAAPINRAIMAGRSMTGISIMQIDAAMDAGPVFLQASTPIAADEDAVSLAGRLSILGAEKLMEALPLIEEGQIRPQPQDHARASYAPMLRKDEGEIDWSRPCQTICTMIRGLLPWPCAHTYQNGKMLKILRASCEHAEPGCTPGTLLKGRRNVRIACGDGFVIPLELQLEGKKAASSEAFTCGLKTDRVLLGRERNA